MSHAALHAARPARSALTDRVVTTRRWTIAVLVLATTLLVAHTATGVAMVQVLGSAPGAAAGPEWFSVDGPAVARGVAPALLVGWCTGLATRAALTPAETLGARTAGVTAGVVGSAAGAMVLGLTGLL